RPATGRDLFAKNVWVRERRAEYHCSSRYLVQSLLRVIHRDGSANSLGGNTKLGLDTANDPNQNSNLLCSWLDCPSGADCAGIESIHLFCLLTFRMCDPILVFLLRNNP